MKDTKWLQKGIVCIVLNGNKFNQVEILRYFCVLNYLLLQYEYAMLKGLSREYFVEKSKKKQSFIPKKEQKEQSSTWLWLLFAGYIYICLQSYKTNNYPGFDFHTE